MASLWRKSQEVIRDNNDARAAGAKAYFYTAGTTTPLTTYSDNALSTPHAHPVVADGYGRMPAIFLATGTNYKERVTTSTGSLLWEVDNIDPAPATEAESSGSVDDADLLDCGDVVWRPATGTRSGWVRLNGRTIGNASSSATERANDDCEALFTLLWNADAAGPDNLLIVSTGKGSSAAADWAANKTLALPDLRGRSPFGLDDMGNSAASRLSGTTFATGNTATKLFSAGGVPTVTLSTGELPSMTSGAESADHTHGYNYPNSATSFSYQAGSTSSPALLIPGVSASDNTGGRSATHTHTITNGGGAHQNMPPFMLGTWYIKLNRETS